MCHKNIVRALTLLLVGASFSALALPAQDEPSVAEAARRAREQKQASSKPVPVVTNDTLAPAPASPSTAALSAPAGTEAAAAKSAAGSTAKQSAADSPEDAEKKKQEMAELKQQIADKQRELNLLERDLALKKESLYSTPDYQHDTDGKNKLDAMQTDLKQMKEDLAALQAKLGDLGPQEETKPAPPQPQP